MILKALVIMPPSVKRAIDTTFARNRAFCSVHISFRHLNNLFKSKKTILKNAVITVNVIIQISDLLVHYPMRFAAPRIFGGCRQALGALDGGPGKGLGCSAILTLFSPAHCFSLDNIVPSGGM
jgi:hypothetical protein